MINASLRLGRDAFLYFGFNYLVGIEISGEIFACIIFTRKDYLLIISCLILQCLQGMIRYHGLLSLYI